MSQLLTQPFPSPQQDGPGTILLCYSCLLSRTPALVTSDMDSNFGVAPKMIGNHGYANQEFVNLFLTGAATSNLFDGEKVRVVLRYARLTVLLHANATPLLFPLLSDFRGRN